MFVHRPTLHPSQVKAPKWKPAAGSPHTLHSWFILGKENYTVLDIRLFFSDWNTFIHINKSISSPWI